MKKKKVLHIVKVMNHGGAETMIMNIYRNIDRTKIEFDFLCLSEKNGDYESEIKQLGGKIFKLPEPQTQGRIKNFYNIYKIMKTGKYDVIHSHIMFYNAFINLIGYMANIKLRISHSHSSNDIKKENIIRKIYMKITRIILNMFSNVKIACGQKAGEYLYGHNKKFVILNNSIDLERYSNITQEEKQKLKNEFGINNNQLIIGHVGRFEKVKNQIFFIQLAKNMKQKELNFKIILVGNGSMYNEILNMIRKEKLEDFFVLPGVRDDINVFMNIFDIFMMPSLYEGFPLTVVEALAGNAICYLSNNISKETNIIESRINFFDLNCDIENLINEMNEKIKNKKEIDVNKILNDKGYSIKGMTEKITDIYMK